jgi:hypothetical protein
MAFAEIDVIALRNAVNAVLDHLIVDLGIDKVAIEGPEDFIGAVLQPRCTTLRKSRRSGGLVH